MKKQWFKQWADDGTVEKVTEAEVLRSLEGSYHDPQDVIDDLDAKQKIRNPFAFMWWEAVSA